MRQRARLLAGLSLWLGISLAACSPGATQSEPPPVPSDLPQTEIVPLPLETPDLLGSPNQSTGSDNPGESPYPAENQAGTGKGLVRGNVEVEESRLEISENPARVELSVTGYLPTPCHTLGWEVLPVSRGVIQVDVFSEVDPELLCVQVLEPYDALIELTRLLPGDYEIWVNGTFVDNFHLDTRAGYP